MCCLCVSFSAFADGIDDVYDGLWLMCITFNMDVSKWWFMCLLINMTVFL